jgi:hypothetical protein
MLCRVVAIAALISGIFTILTGIVFSLAKGSFSWFGQYIIVFLISIVSSFSLSILLYSSLAMSTIHKVKGITPKTQTITSVALALVVLVLGAMSGFNSRNFQTYLFLTSGFIGAGILFWLEIPDKLLGNTFKSYKSQ